MPECIHGLEFDLCDICSPSAKPAPAPRDVTPAVRRATPPRTGSSRTAAPVLDLARTRVFHITHVDNLIGIAEEGALVAGAEPLLDISAPGVRSARAARTADGRAIAEHVAFLTTLEAPVWVAIRSGEPDPRLALPAGVVPGDFVILAATLDALDGFVVADGDAAHPLTRFASGREERARALRSVTADATGRGLDAEVLVPDRVPLAAIAVATVGSERTKRAATDALASGGFRTRVAIHPPWFQA
ncbi:DarT ssDNA thymidine ADP-ribosyltransferase family protein [Galbitalea sp. SE-J8]|uniref:DarT ssDNA thymidine ADP-ribosyltransferase family protein n=1 Tax=Galbitalea sp. SE-J8 TaxID=3054952 RepID=UPI00259D30AF|nr:DarT ssDNA thymidine ADP-ribosyltransferase family protein [Galbitalea sp. SE-J8]MDM4763166.1 DarT ssDNA thymidine ADP-ribosyltransferase family protein [Galbitalea sp. SE-J8]